MCKSFLLNTTATATVEISRIVTANVAGNSGIEGVGLGETELAGMIIVWVGLQSLVSAGLKVISVCQFCGAGEINGGGPDLFVIA